MLFKLIILKLKTILNELFFFKLCVTFNNKLHRTVKIDYKIKVVPCQSPSIAQSIVSDASRTILDIRTLDVENYYLTKSICN